MERLLLGIDPGSHRLGIGFVLATGTVLKLVHAEVVEASARLPLYERLERIGQRVKQLVAEYSPAEAAVEETFFAKNAKSAFHLGLARGVAIAACLDKRTPIYEYAPTQVKAAVTGYGRADKDQVKRMVGLILGEQLVVKLGWDASDALAIAICHAQLSRMAVLTR